jgi:hypothetical protein
MKLRRPWTEQDDQDLTKAIAQGVSVGRMTVRLKRHEHSILRRVKLLGLTLRPVRRLSESKQVGPLSS